MKPSDISKAKPFTTKTHGFTLIEVMIVVAVMGLITVAAWPSYDRYQTKSRRTDGINALLQNSAQLEKCFINYADDALNPGYTHAKCAVTPLSPEKHYAIAVTNLSAETYTLTATPQGAQVDPECTVLTLTHLGVKGFTNTNSGTDPIGNLKRCWSQ